MTVAEHIDPDTYGRLTAIAYEGSGIQLRAGKEAFLRNRLGRRMRTLGIASIEAYVDRLERDDVERLQFIQLLTTHTTSFFRESSHFDVLVRDVYAAGPGPYKVWCAAASTGEEPYTLAMVSSRHLVEPGLGEVRILATDISNRALDSAKAGRYPAAARQMLPKEYQGYLHDIPGEPGYVVVDPRLRDLLRFARLNLMEEFPMRGPFDAIFLRNVLMYFSPEDRVRIPQKVATLLRPGGLLFVGHSEMLRDPGEGLVRVENSVYQRLG